MNNNTSTKLLFTYLKTGGGHLAPAKALSKYFEKYYKDKTDIVLIDGLDNSTRYSKFVIEDGYRILQGKFKWFYEALYALHKIRFISRISAGLVSIQITKRLTEIILKEKPDKIVIFHFFLIIPIYDVIKKLKLSIPVFTFVTDPFIAPVLWFLRKDQNFILFSNELKSKCVQTGIKAENIRVFNFVLDEKYSNPASAGNIALYKKDLGFTKDKVLLILGGGDGIPKGITILKNVLKSKSDFEVAIVCGNNKELYNNAQKIKSGGKYENLKIFGYVNYIYELISLSDVVISKCGASTSMELLISKKVQVINTYLWEQEKGNVDFLVRNNLGIFENNISKLQLIVEEMFSDGNTLDKYRTNIANYNLQNGLADVADYLMNS